MLTTSVLGVSLLRFSTSRCGHSLRSRVLGIHSISGTLSTKSETREMYQKKILDVVVVLLGWLLNIKTIIWWAGFATTFVGTSRVMSSNVSPQHEIGKSSNAPSCSTQMCSYHFAHNTDIRRANSQLSSFASPYGRSMWCISRYRGIIRLLRS